MEIKSINNLKDNLEKLIDKHRLNMKLRKKITNEFLSKGLNIEVVQMLFEDDIQIAQLNKYELIALTISMYKTLKLTSINPVNYFSTNELDEYNLIVVIPNEKKTEIIFNNVIKLNDSSYLTSITAEQLTEYLDEKLIGYNKALQRPPVEVKLGRSIVKKISINKENVNDLKHRYLSEDINGKKIKDYEPLPTTISLAVLDEGMPLEIKFVGEATGKLIIKPSFTGEKLTKVYINDGFHRILALTQAYKEHYKLTGEKLNISLGCIINIANKEKIKQLVVDSMKVTLPKEIDIETITPNAKNKLVEKIIENSEVLNHKVADNVNHIDNTDFVTGKNLLNYLIELSNLDDLDDIKINIIGKKISNIIDILYKRLEELNSKAMRKKLFMCVAMSIASNLIEEKDYLDNIIELCDKILDMEKNNNYILNTLNNKFSTKNNTVKDIYDYFSNI